MILRRIIMKFAKKFFVVALTVALLISCVSLFASAEAPALSLDVENIESILEYRQYATYLAEAYETDDGEYVLDSKFKDAEEKQYFSFVKPEGVTANVADAKLVITKPTANGTGYKMYRDGSILTKRLAVSLDFMSEGAGVEIRATLRDYFEDIVLFSADAAGKTFTYADYDCDRVVYKTVTSDAQLEAGAWYHADAVLDIVGGKYTVSLTCGDTAVISYSCKVLDSVGVDSLKIYALAPADAENAKITLDNVFVYEGANPRNVYDPENALADSIIEIDAYLKSEAASLEDKLAIADLYAKLYEEGGYTAPEGINEYEKVDAIVKSAKADRNKVYAEALITYAANIMSAGNYYEKIEYRDTYAAKFYNMFSSNASVLEGMDGMTDEYTSGVTYADAVLAAKNTYVEATQAIENIKAYSEDFVKEVEEGYDSSSDNYNYMLAKYGKLSVLISKVDSDYKYADAVPSTKYPTVADAITEYKALEAKIAEIEANVAVFVPAVAAMDMTQVDALTAESPFLTKNFEALYANYLTASSVYSNGRVHAALDSETYPGLSASVARYKECAAYVEGRIEECNLFISMVNGADASAYYLTVKQQVENAAPYLDTNKEKSLEKYEGVEDAIARYKKLVKRLEDYVANSAKYIASVNEIDMTASYAVLRAKVNAALLLKENGNVTGIEGVKEANVKLAEAEAKVSALEGYSETLISAVEALKSAKTLAERRYYIFIANGAKDKAETSISGVTAARSELEAQITQYNADVAAANAVFATVIEGACSASASAAPASALYKATSAMVALVK